MKTDNNNIVVESLEDAIKTHINNLPHATMRATSFKSGANWQKEQLQPLIDSHRELLEALERISKAACANNEFECDNELQNSVFQSESAIEKANNIINSLKV